MNLLLYIQSVIECVDIRRSLLYLQNSWKRNGSISVTKVGRAQINLGARSGARHHFQRLTIQMDHRVKTRARGLDFGDHLAAQICLIHFALHFSSKNDTIFFGKYFDDVKRSAVFRELWNLETVGVDWGEGSEMVESGLRSSTAAEKFARKADGSDPAPKLRSCQVS